MPIFSLLSNQRLMDGPNMCLLVASLCGFMDMQEKFAELHGSAPLTFRTFAKWLAVAGKQSCQLLLENTAS